ncbi:MAG TPA: hypothetical protein VD997_07510 [Phycisphaerales bacterium]|nr:hypothetical protein [Phycisphaerales bacterium]
MKTSILPVACVVALSGLAGPCALAQFSSDPANNLTIADRTGDQVQPKVRAAPDGGLYVSWFDNSTGGYDVYLQRLDAAGNEQWAHNGVLIADRAVSSTQDYDVVVDAQGNATLAFNDDGGVSGTPQQVTVKKVAPDGSIVWARTITTDSTFKGPPQLTLLTDGGYAVGWTAGTSPSSWTMQRLDATGQPQWSGNGINVIEPTRYTALSDIQASDNGSFIVLWIRGTSTSATTSSKHLLAMKYDSTGAPLWTPTTVAAPLGPVTGVVVYQPTPGSAWSTSTTTGTYNATLGGSIQNGYFPTMIPDGQGGVVIGWYENGGPRNAYIQHLHADGSYQFPINGVSNVLGPGTRIRIGAEAAYDASTQTYYLASPESNASPQGNYSTIVNAFNASGARLWSDLGTTVIPANANQSSFVQCQAIDGGAIVAGFDARSTAPTHVVFAARVNAEDGAVAWSNLPSSTVVSKSRLSSTKLANGSVVLGWSNGASGGAADIQVQNVNPDGTFGGPSCPGNACGPQDYNGDGDSGTDQDIEAFFACLGGNCCDACFCQGSDFNGDGDFGTDQDIEAFFRVLGGNAC